MEHMDVTYLDCACYTTEHTLRFVYDKEDNILYAEMFMSQYHGFFKRCWLAIKYVFGAKCKYGHWDCFILKPTDTHVLRGLLDKLDGLENVGVK